MGNVIPGEPPIVSYAAPFTVLAGGPRPMMTATPSTVTVTDGLFLLTATGDHCVRPDGDSEVLVYLYGPEGTDQNSPTYGVSAGHTTPDAKGDWSVTLERRTDIPPPVAGTYQLVGQCLLGTDGYESANGFEYPSLHVDIVNTTPPPTTTPEPVTAVRATPAYTG